LRLLVKYLETLQLRVLATSPPFSGNDRRCSDHHRVAPFLVLIDGSCMRLHVMFLIDDVPSSHWTKYKL
jgi:hypothetical protein